MLPDDLSDLTTHWVPSSTPFPRRGLFVLPVAALAIGAMSPASRPGTQPAAPSPIRNLKVTEIEVHHVTPEYNDWISYQLNHHFGPAHRSVYVAHTNQGLYGLGDGLDENEAVIRKYI